MLLSEAILLGSVGSKQGFGIASGDPASNQKCVIGAALFAVGVKRSSDYFAELLKWWPWVNKETTIPSVINGSYLIARDRTVLNILWKLNDTARWSRPQIAAWVATEEVRLGIVPQEEKTQPILEVSYEAKRSHLVR